MQDYGGWIWFLAEIGLLVVLTAALIYGITMWRNRPRDSATEAVRDDATDRLYHKQQ